ncbi:GNAT family N-acetyltransferase [Pelomonas sp. SE-A7]|uniref:GNAT family N-acetyltransferase n=1 Tax=Pelomonas sp. SE-A7 TaxID=3054953 RepID=UPI00259C820D|nr:GNAT family N-acetyltransferase [Pelomonas sp. SE-A7]MDM4767930.1 GNAT family N-acetyltransferase [Pelomonas sp. SE-A7]
MKYGRGEAGLRAAGPADAPVLAALCAEHAAYERLANWPADPGLASRLAEALASGRLNAWLVLTGSGEALGYASVTLDFATLGAYRFAHLDCLYLRPAARRQGLGQRLLDCVQAFASQQGCRELQWQTPPWNQGAIAFYEACGAQGCDKRRFRLALPR